LKTGNDKVFKARQIITALYARLLSE